MELKEGMYAITKDRLCIAKITRIEHGRIYGVMKQNDNEYIINSEKYNFYANPVELIEAGDYVNGYKVIDKDYCTPGDDFTDFDPYWNVVVNKQGSIVISEYEIETIVTKEQFTKEQFVSLEYRLVDKC